jgi:hypothetical protein
MGKINPSHIHRPKDTKPPDMDRPLAPSKRSPHRLPEPKWFNMAQDRFQDIWSLTHLSRLRHTSLNTRKRPFTNRLRLLDTKFRNTAQLQDTKPPNPDQSLYIKPRKAGLILGIKLQRPSQHRI